MPGRGGAGGRRVRVCSAALGSLASQQQGRVGGLSLSGSGSLSQPFEDQPAGSFEVFQFNTVAQKPGSGSFEFFRSSAPDGGGDFGRP